MLNENARLAYGAADIRGGLTAAGVVLAIPVVGTVLYWLIFSAGLDYNTRVEVDASGFFGLEAVDNTSIVSWGWVAWVVVAVIMFLAQSRLYLVLPAAFGRQVSEGIDPFKGMGLWDRMKMSLALERVDQGLFLRISGRRRRQIRRELKANLAESASVEGPDEALRRLGSISELTREYLEAEQGRRIDIASGLMWALGLIAALHVQGLALAIAFSEGLRAANYSDAASHSFGWITVEGSVNSFGVTFNGWPYLVLAVAGFALGCKPWRLFRD